jgi:MazG family protein
MSSPDRAAEAFARLVQIMAALRAPDGCPWDRAQTIDSLEPYVLEETYEVLDAIDRHDHAALCEELGDFLFEAVFLAQMEAEAGHFTIADSLAAIADKLVRRHPHVFQRSAPGSDGVRTAEDVRVRWEEIKAEEKAARGGTGKGSNALLAGIAPTLPALLRAYHIGLRAASVNFDWTQVSQVVDKIQEEVDELREAVARGEANRRLAEEEMGDLLFSIAQLARQLEIEPETALRKANDKFTRRFGAMERAIAASGRAMRELPLDELEREWRRAKAL